MRNERGAVCIVIVVVLPQSSLSRSLVADRSANLPLVFVHFSSAWPQCGELITFTESMSNTSILPLGSRPASVESPLVFCLPSHNRA